VGGFRDRAGLFPGEADVAFDAGVLVDAEGDFNLEDLDRVADGVEIVDLGVLGVKDFLAEDRGAESLVRTDNFLADEVEAGVCASFPSFESTDAREDVREGVLDTAAAGALALALEEDLVAKIFLGGGDASLFFPLCCNSKRL
jgi:hypothetical protein